KRERTAHMNRVVTCGRRANTRQRTIDQIQQFNQFRFWNRSLLNKRLRECLETWICNLVQLDTASARLPMNAASLIIFGNNEVAHQFAASVAQHQCAVQRVIEKPTTDRVE